ncbi:MAG: PspA/IM30 family protein [Gemmatimonadales bacterium]|nr:MAG: PspA/IM30 family protein [Gemmatimonadales bacterium]
MSIFHKISTLFRSNINDLIARAENPEKMLNQIILDMRDQLSKAKREVAAAIADERKLRAQVEDEAKQARDWERRAMLAVQEGRDDLAKQALLRQQEHAERAQSLEATWSAQSQETEKLKASLRQLNDKIEEAKRKRNLLIAKQKRAQAQKRIHQTMSGLSDTSAFEAFNRMAERIEESERRSLAAAEVSEALSGDTLEDEFAQLEAGGAGNDMDRRLQALKQQMGLIAPSSEERPQLSAGEVQDGEVEEEEGEGADAAANSHDASAAQASSGKGTNAEIREAEIREAELLEEFDRLERRDAR